MSIDLLNETKWYIRELMSTSNYYYVGFNARTVIHIEGNCGIDVASFAFMPKHRPIVLPFKHNGYRIQVKQAKSWSRG